VSAYADSLSPEQRPVYEAATALAGRMLAADLADMTQT
jgi:hypothetical protein